MIEEDIVTDIRQEQIAALLNNQEPRTVVLNNEQWDEVLLTADVLTVKTVGSIRGSIFGLDVIVLPDGVPHRLDPNTVIDMREMLTLVE